MIPEIGHYALILALFLAITQGILPLLGANRNNVVLMAVARPAVFAQFGFLIFGFGCLVYAFVTNDFTVQYVAQHSNSQLPVWYRISALWAGHEGSMLLWIVLLAGWQTAVALFSQSLPQRSMARVLAVMGLVNTGFLLFLLLTSNPFVRIFADFPLDGRDLNPLLQDIGLILHPPMLYMGYVGFSVVFAFAITALWEGRLDSAWARWLRPWTVIAWCFLTLGIALGSWWAYYELGWGGWWFWDPVENASFMPWLCGTALIHSLAATEKRSVFKSWTLLLAIATFSLSLLGTFLVRSGVLTSVHAFATDPTRGIFILLFLALVIGASLLLFAAKAHCLQRGSDYGALSRETALLTNNIILTTAVFVVFIGTLFPLVADVLEIGKLSVGAPYFNALFVPLMALLLIAMVAGPIIRWKQYGLAQLAKDIGPQLLLSVVLVAGWLWTTNSRNWIVVLLFMILSCWAWLVLMHQLLRKMRAKAWSLRNLTSSYKGMVLAHLGVVVCIVGVTLSSGYSEERDVKLMSGQTVNIGPYDFKLVGIEDGVGPNYTLVKGDIAVYEDGHLTTHLYPEKRMYAVQNMPMTEAAIDAGLTRDLYVALGEPLADGAWAVRIYYKPFIRWIWLGGLLMALGGFWAIHDRRYRLQIKPQPTTNTAAEASV